MQENFIRRNLSLFDEEITRERCLDKEIEILNLNILKNFFRFQISTMRGKITKNVKKSTDDSFVIFRKCFFAEFIRVTEIEIGKTEKIEIYKINLITNSFGKYTV
jgi:hypothetical protein